MHVKNLRESTKVMFQDHKWIILIRDNNKEDWRPFANQFSHIPYKYQDLDKAIYAMKHFQHSRYRIGNAKLSKLEDWNNANKV